MTYEHLDPELINVLLRDGRASYRSLADDLDVSVTTISAGFEPATVWSETRHSVRTELSAHNRG